MLLGLQHYNRIITHKQEQDRFEAHISHNNSSNIGQFMAAMVRWYNRISSQNRKRTFKGVN